MKKFLEMAVVGIAGCMIATVVLCLLVPFGVILQWFIVFELGIAVALEIAFACSFFERIKQERIIRKLEYEERRQSITRRRPQSH